MKKAITVNFKIGLYSQAAIKKTIEAYSEIADFAVRKKGNALAVTMTGFNDDVAGRLKDEFANYVLYSEEKIINGKNTADR